MALAFIRRVCAFSLFLNLCLISAYEIPEVKIQAFSPKGFRASIPDAPNLSLFVFQGNINREIDNNDVGSLSGEVLEARDGNWVFEDPRPQLKVGDVVNYYVFASVNSAGYLKDNLSFTVTALEVPETPLSSTPTPQSSPDPTPQPSPNPNPLVVPSSGQCQPSLTTIRGATACAGQTIFEDNFETLREDIWQVEQYIPTEHPEYPFVSYQRLAVSVASGNLVITPQLLQNLPGHNNESVYSGNLDLFSGCTGSLNECSARASGASILPPVVTGRITSKGLAFTYGTVHVRAKLPQGDWLYPEILLEPFRKKYGGWFSSGVLKIACARGNKQLSVGITEFGNKVLYGGPIMDFDCRHYLITEKKLNSRKTWGDDFHVYSVNWTPDRITLLVDGEEWAWIDPVNNGLRDRFPQSCRNLPREFLAMGSKMAPFDDHFYITLGVAAGGITEFRDDLYTGGFRPKPWKNSGRKARLSFWQDMDSWLGTWSNPQLLVDYVKVVAL